MLAVGGCLLVAVGVRECYVCWERFIFLRARLERGLPRARWLNCPLSTLGVTVAHPIGADAAFSSAAAFAAVSLRDMGKGAGKGGSLANAGACCSEPCLKNFPGATPCGTCYWGFTPCGFLSALLFPVVGLVCCCTPDCEVCGCQCNKTVKRGDQQLARRRYLFGVIPMGSQEVHTTDRNPWYKKRLGLF